MIPFYLLSEKSSGLSETMSFCNPVIKSVIKPES